MIIDTEIIQEALNYYGNLNYEPIKVPYIIDSSVIDITRPPGLGYNTKHLGFEYVASAEQGIINMILNGDDLPDKGYAISPCVRKYEYDEIHFKVFLKIELFSKNDNYHSLLDDAYLFFDRYMGVYKRTTDIGIDIFKDDIELGSYGVRHIPDNNYLKYFSYGTGLAEPRFTIARNNKRYENVYIR